MGFYLIKTERSIPKRQQEIFGVFALHHPGGSLAMSKPANIIPPKCVCDTQCVVLRNSLSKLQQKYFRAFDSTTL